jgi:ATP-dependent DNA ligase
MKDMPTARLNGFIAPCIATRAAKPPSGPDWVHEIKHDGYRLIVRCDGETIRLFTRRGCDWSARYPAITRAATKLRARSFTIDGEAAVCGPDGVTIFDALHRRGTVTEAMLFAFDLLELDGVDCRPLRLAKRKQPLARLVDRRLVGIVINEHTDARSELVFEQACRMGLEGIVSKRLSAPYRSGLHEIGSRLRTRTARRWCGIGRGDGETRFQKDTPAPSKRLPNPSY